MLGRRSCAPLSFVLMLGCLPTANLQLAETPPPALFVERAAETKPAPAPPVESWPCVPDGERALTLDDPTTVPCAPALDDTRASYFNRVSLYLPEGLDEQNFVEFTPTFARNPSPVESVTCTDDLPGVMINFAALVVLEAKPTTTALSMREEILQAFGYANMDFCPTVTETEHVLESVFTMPESDEVPEPTAVLLRIVIEGDLAVALVYEIHPFAWIVAHDTLFASARSLVVR